MKTLDLVTLTVTAADAAAAAATFRRSFGFEVAGEQGGRTTLAIGDAGIEFAPATGEERGLHAITLRVESLAKAEEALRAKGLSPRKTEAGGKTAVTVGPDGTHGARLVFVER